MLVLWLNNVYIIYYVLGQRGNSFLRPEDYSLESRWWWWIPVSSLSSSSFPLLWYPVSGFCVIKRKVVEFLSLCSKQDNPTADDCMIMLLCCVFRLVNRISYCNKECPRSLASLVLYTVTDRNVWKFFAAQKQNRTVICIALHIGVWQMLLRHAFWDLKINHNHVIVPCLHQWRSIVHHSVYSCRNKWVFRALRKAGAEWRFLMCGGIWFQILGRQTENACFPNWIRVHPRNAKSILREIHVHYKPSSTICRGGIPFTL